MSVATLRSSCKNFYRILNFSQFRVYQNEFKCRYARGGGGGYRRKGRILSPHNIKLSDIPDECQLNSESQFIDPDEGEKSKSFEDVYNSIGERGPSVAELKRMAKKDREKLKLKILKQKFFKDPQETNLLTWEAKEQIRFLHQEFPEDWTVEKLSQSFPISKDGLINLLKSSYIIESSDKIVEHDLKVKQRWKELESDLSRKGGPINPLNKMLIESGKLDLMKNAATLKGSPRAVVRLEDRRKTECQEEGIFSSILKGSTKNKRKEKEDKKSLESNEADLKKLLEVIYFQQNNLKGEYGSSSGRNSEIIKKSSINENPITDFGSESPQNQVNKLKARKISIKSHSYLEAYQLRGTGKVVSDQSVKINEKFDKDIVVRKEEKQEHFEYSETKKYPSLPRNFNNTFLHSLNSPVKSQIKIPEHLKHKKGILYKKNDTYYDENGEMLFRIPFHE